MMSRYKSDRPEFLSTEGEVPDSGSASGPRMDEGQGQEQGRVQAQAQEKQKQKKEQERRKKKEWGTRRKYKK